MSITVHSRFLRVRDCVGEGKASAILQDTLDIAGGYPDVERVIAAHAVPRHMEAVAGEGQVTVRGAMDVRLLYAALPAPGHGHSRGHDDGHEPDDEHEHADPRLVLAEFSDRCPFEVVVTLPGTTPGCRAWPTVAVDSVAASLVSRRRLGVDVAIVAGVRVCEDQEVRAAVDVAAVPPDRVRCVKETVHVEHLAAEGAAPLRLDLSLALPPEELPLSDILWVTPRCRHVTGRAAEGRVFLEGAVDVDVLYLTGDGASPVQAFSWPDAHRFTVPLDLAAARPGMVVLGAVDFSGVSCSREGDRCLTVVADGEVRAVVRQVMDLPLITDVACEAGGPLDVIRRTVRFPHHLPEGRHDYTAGGVLSLPPTRPPVDCVLWSDAAYIPDQVVVEDDRVLVEGDLSLRLLYRGVDGAVCHADFPRALRLSDAVDLPGIRPGMMAHAQVSVHACAVRLVDPETLQVDVVLKIEVRGMRTVQVEVVVEVVAVAPCPPGTTLRMVIVQPGDTLWKLSRRYGVPLEAVIRANPQIPDPDLIYPGQRVRIPCAPVDGPAVAPVGRG